MTADERKQTAAADAHRPVAVGAYLASDCPARLRENAVVDCLDCPEDCDKAIEVRVAAPSNR